MPKLAKSKLVRINAARKAARRVERVEKDGEASRGKRVEMDGSVDGPVEIPVNGYSIYHFPNLNLFVKVRYETWLTAKGYQPSESSLKKVTPEFVSKVLAAKIEGRL
ncbi:hypothetical protein Ferp_0508 [Ferroglobus placidus DSM 10642]|uniref:Uncharacterized protein n=1 Tax=Ferroglobus placidus (strain DSM 10642 / AEDII12DO) TaxID=589924 RepID=D3S349_FERPA|nr:hypothetical protein [Ferroglobus placidus]ADC64682.1 hypothetical protein Ferp_0508 [Ferroglobus placidus DSM 10642]